MLSGITLGCIVLLSSPTLAQTPTKAITSPAATKQWEYLAVSFGKTLFSDPIAEPEIKATGSSKLLAFSKAGIVTAQEAISTQRQMDALGRFGWELVGTVGTIGGDQELLFKRPFDPAESKREASLITQEGKLLAAEQQAEAAKVRDQPMTELIDQDAVARQAALDAYRRQEEKRLKDAVATMTGAGYILTQVTATSTAESPTSSGVLGDVTVDGTSILLHDGNKYSGDAAKKMAVETANMIYKEAGLVLTDQFASKELDAYTGPVKVNVHVVINFHGQPQEVATERCGGKWPS